MHAEVHEWPARRQGQRIEVVYLKCLIPHHCAVECLSCLPHVHLVLFSTLDCSVMDGISMVDGWVIDGVWEVLNNTAS